MVAMDFAISAMRFQKIIFHLLSGQQSILLFFWRTKIFTVVKREHEFFAGVCAANTK